LPVIMSPMSILTQQWSGGAKNFSDHGKDIAGR
jgi:hypothetical protein